MWAVAKRIFLFTLVNILIITSISLVFGIVTTALGIQLTPNATMFAFYAAIGFGGAFVSLLLSKKMAKWTMGVQIISPDTRSSAERELLESVYRLARFANLKKMPEVGIYQSPEINAFATGPSKNNSLVAVSSGLLNRMSKEEVEGVLAHEIAHVANGDMVTMTLIQGVINTMVLILARVISSLVTSQANERSRPWLQYLVFQALQIALSILGSLVVCYFSRHREFRADAGGAKIAGREKMVAALKALQRNFGPAEIQDAEQHASIAALKISGRSTSALAMMFATHPPLEDRIQALQKA